MVSGVEAELAALTHVSRDQLIDRLGQLDPELLPTFKRLHTALLSHFRDRLMCMYRFGVIVQQCLQERRDNGDATGKARREGEVVESLAIALGIASARLQECLTIAQTYTRREFADLVTAVSRQAQYELLAAILDKQRQAARRAHKEPEVEVADEDSRRAGAAECRPGKPSEGRGAAPKRAK